MALKLSEIANKLGYQSNSLKELCLKAKDSEGYAFDVTNAGKIIDGKLPYWNIWSNISPARWSTVSSRVQCNCDSVVKYSELGANHDMSAHPPLLELPTKLYSGAVFRGTLYGSEWNAPANLTQIRVFCRNYNSSQITYSDFLPLPTTGTMIDYAIRVSDLGSGAAYFGLMYYNSAINNFELQEMRFDTDVYVIPSTTTLSVVEINYNFVARTIIGFAVYLYDGSSNQETNNIAGTIEYCDESGQVEAGLGVFLTGTITGLNRSTLIEYTLPTPIRLDDITNYGIKFSMSIVGTTAKEEIVNEINY